VAGALLAAGIVAAILVGGRSTSPPATPGTAVPVASPTTAPTAPTRSLAPGPAPTTVPEVTIPATTTGPTPSSSTLSGDLLAFADLGGFYDTVPTDSAMQLASSTCLTELGPAGAASSAQTYFAGPAAGSLPAINEVLAGYDGTAAARAYTRDVGILGHCTPLTLTLDGTAASVTLAADTDVLPVGDAESAFTGNTTVAGRTEAVSVAVVLRSQVVVLIVYVDTVPASNAIYGDFPSTIAAAVGKLA
jgi:hypothetical protein